MDEENIDESGSAFGTVFVSPGSGKSSSKDLRDVPVENAAEIPLFLDADKRGTKSAIYLRITKNDEPNSGYKGQVPLSTTIDSIARLFGNGYFTIELCNHKHQVLRTKENVKIDVPMGTNLTRNNDEASTDASIVKDLIAGHEKEIDRLVKQLTLGTGDAERRSKEYTDLVKTTVEKSADRERVFMQGQQKMQQDFFGSLMLQQNQMFQQTMVLLSAGHRMTIESLQAVLGNQNKGSDVDTLLKGIAVAQSLGGDDDEPWVKALGHGENMLTKLLALKGSNNNTETKPNAGKPTKAPISKSELLEIVRLKKVLNERGIDFTDLVRDARAQLEQPDSEQESSPSSESNSPENDSEAS